MIKIFLHSGLKADSSSIFKVVVLKISNNLKVNNKQLLQVIGK